MTGSEKSAAASGPIFLIGVTSKAELIRWHPLTSRFVPTIVGVVASETDHLTISVQGEGGRDRKGRSDPYAVVSPNIRRMTDQAGLVFWRCDQPQWTRLSAALIKAVEI